MGVSGGGYEDVAGGEGDGVVVEIGKGGNLEEEGDGYEVEGGKHGECDWVEQGGGRAGGLKRRTWENM